MNYQNMYSDMAAASLQGQVIDREQCQAILNCPPDRMLELLQAAFKVRRACFGNKVILQQLINAKSGLCTEDCAYCAQSAASQAGIEKYPLLDKAKLLEGAHIAKASQAQRYCIVTSGYSPQLKELDQLCQTISAIKEKVNIELCASLGHLSEADAVRLKQAGADRYNHNLNTCERLYPQICTTHTYADRVQTLLNARNAGLKICCGALVGMGETADDVIDLALALREVQADSIPINFLHAIEGTALENANHLTPLKCLSILCLMRLLNPRTEIRAAGGREVQLRSLQAMALYPANSIFVSGYLTTDGQSPEEACRMIADMGFEVEQEAVQKAKAA